MAEALRHPAFDGPISRQQLIDWYRATRERSAELFSMIAPETYYDRPIALRNPIVFYEGHLPAFAVNVLVKLAHKRRGIDTHFETLFARGIDPADEAAVRDPASAWPSRADVQAYGQAADALVVRVLAADTLSDPQVPMLRGGEAVFTIIEHELMHQETLLYMFHEMPYDKKSRIRPDGTPGAAASSPKHERVRVPAGTVTLGADRSLFGWDNEFPSHTEKVKAFSIDRFNITNGDYLEFMKATGATAPHFWQQRNGEWFWRGMFDLIPLPPSWPVWVTHEQAEAYARWKGCRLPTEAEYHRAAFGTADGGERPLPWGDAKPDSSHGNFDFASFEPAAVDAHPAGASAFGVEGLIGNGWEWTATKFDPFPGFEAMPSYPQYSADFFDGEHFVMKGASPVTARELIRRSFRNWFRPKYPYMYAKFRCVSDR